MGDLTSINLLPQLPRLGVATNLFHKKISINSSKKKKKSIKKKTINKENVHCTWVCHFKKIKVTRFLLYLETVVL